jgi:adenylate cyclase
VQPSTSPVQPPQPRRSWSSSQTVRLLIGRHGRPAAAAILLMLAVGFAGFGYPAWHPVRNAVFDAFQKHFPRALQPETSFPVVIVDIDDASLLELGRWPWPRTRLARLIAETHRLGALAVGLDIIMPEPDGLSPGNLLAHRRGVPETVHAALADLPSNDAILARTLKRTPSVVARAGLIDSVPDHSAVFRRTPVMISGPSPADRLPSYGGHIANIDLLENAARGRGYLNDTRDADGVVRAMPLMVTVNGKLAPALSIELLRVAIGANWVTVDAGPDGIRGIAVGDQVVAADADGRLRLYFSKADARRRVSALTVLSGGIPDGGLARRVAIIGVTGVGTSDVATTPVAARMDGVEIQAQVIENILAGSHLVRPVRSRWIELGLFLGLGLTAIALLPRFRPGTGAALFTGAAAVMAAASLAAFWQWRLLVDASFPVAGNLLVMTVMLVAGLAASDRNRRELNAALETERLARVRMAGELQAAREIQMGMLPSPGAIAGLPPAVDFFALLEPAEEVGGDLYDAFMIDADRFFFLVGDVSGKGVPASLFMALSKTLCKNAALREALPLDALMQLANAEISRENPAMLFVTALAGILDTASGALQLCSAGHETPVLIRRGQPPRFLEPAGGPPLCALTDFPYGADQMVLAPGDVLLLITDGITEAQAPDGQLYGRDRALAVVTDLAHADPGAREMCQGLYNDVLGFAEGTPAADDITIMALRLMPSGSTGRDAPGRATGQ